MIYHLNINHFKNLLVSNKWQLYQIKLEQSISNPNYINKINDGRYAWHCDEIHCCYAGVQYRKCTSNITYDKIKNVNFKLPLDKIKIKEELWYNIKNKETFKIDGVYYATDYNYKNTKIYTPIHYMLCINNTYLRINEPLTLNGVPINFLHKRRIYTKETCEMIHYSFDLSIYCKMVHYILKCKKYKHLIFHYLPHEIIRYILYLTSILF